ncbi:hypothetical protein NPIL_147091 [Nephila pilipes]|uniref:Uncharacterized protein n=1 Tax=Nephila pilipes TaxID=299642 RepID=A0A8X6QTU3_NEPPI|nr:hypothetical protein NPIL_147091 [Nephila pilipes]
MVRGTIETSASVSIKYLDLEVPFERYNRLISFVLPPGEPSDDLSSFFVHFVARCLNNVPDYRSSCWLIGDGNVSLVHGSSGAMKYPSAWFLRSWFSGSVA